MDSTQLGEEWHPTKNLPLLFNLNIPKSHKYWWLGTCGHEWDTTLQYRLGGSTCPYCSNKRILLGFNDLSSKNPILALEWHLTRNGNLKPTHVTAGAARKVWWQCIEKHEWEATISHRARGDKCPVCSGIDVLVGFNDLTTDNPVLAAEWHRTKNFLSVYEVTTKSTQKVWWLGASCGHEWEATVNARTRGNGCPVCSGKKILIGFNDLAATNPTLASEWHPTKNGNLTSSQITIGTHTKIWWLGRSCNHEWKSLPKDRARGDGCPYCAGRKVLVGFNDLATTDPALASEWHPIKNGNLTSSEVSFGSNVKVWWLGTCGHEWDTMLTQRATGNRSGCPFCSGHRLLINFNDLYTTHPEIASEWHPTKNGKITAQQVIAGASKKVWWLGAKCCHEWETSIYRRTNRSSGCPICIGHIVLLGFNDMATTHPMLAAEWHPTKNSKITAQQIIAGSHSKAWWLGRFCGHEWYSQIKSRASGRGCPKCTNQVSKAEEQIREFLTKLGFIVESSNRKILNGKEIDLWIPEKNMGIEFNGIYWHTETSGKNRTYHYNKWLKCKNQGIQLIQIWEDDWNLRSKIIMRTLAHKLGVSGTEISTQATKVIPITEQQAEDFLKENHLQGFASGAYYLGLVEQGGIETLQALMVLDNKQDSEDKSLEIIRYANIANVNENFSRLLSYAIDAYRLESITVITDHCEADEELYVTNGFIVEKELPPDYMYVVRAERKLNSEYPLERFRDDPTLLWEEELTEMELADLNGLDRIWDAGKTLYRLVL